jgi:hypothetical protein
MQPRRPGPAVAPFGFAPFAQPAIGASDDRAPVTEVMDYAEQPPRLFSPVPPDILREWRKMFVEGNTKLWNILRRDTGVLNGDPDCDKEWEDAREMCRDMFDPGNYGRSKGVRKYNTVEECARGNVSERCGGNPVDHGDSDWKPNSKSSVKSQPKRRR